MTGGDWGPGKRVNRARVVLSGSSSLETSAERALDRVVRSGQRVSVLRLYLSRLRPPGPRAYHSRVARCLFDDIVQQGGGQVFACGKGDLVLMAGPDAVATLGNLLLRLFRREAAGDRPLLGLWVLPADEAAVRVEFAAAPGEVSVPDEPPAPLGAIATIGTLLAAAPPTEFIRRHRAVRIVGNRVTDLFHELNVSLPAIEARMGGAFSFGTDTYLLRYVVTQFERQMLAALAKAGLEHIPALNLNLPVSYAAAAGLTAIRDAARRAGTRLGVELALADIVADLPSFTKMRDRLRAEGCTVVLDGVDHHTLLQCDPAALAVDMVKIDWSPAIPTLPQREQRALRRALEAFGTDRIVIDRAESEAALVWGRSQGIASFQGRHVDLMLAADRIGLCMHSAGCSIRQCIDRSAAVDEDGQAGCFDPALLGGQPQWGPKRLPAATA